MRIIERYLLHLKKDLVHKISMMHKERYLDLAKWLIEYMFFRASENLRNIGSY